MVDIKTSMVYAMETRRVKLTRAKRKETGMTRSRTGTTLVFLALGVCSILTITALAVTQSVAKDLLRSEDGSVVAGTMLAAKSDIDGIETDIQKLDRRLDNLEKAIVKIQTWGVVLGFLITLGTPFLTVYLNRKLGTPDTLVQDDQGRLFLTLAKKKRAE